MISEETRQLQSDRLLVIRYYSEEDILKAQELEIAQLGYDSKVVNQSYESTTTALRGEISQAANQQRAGQQISPETQQKIDQLYARRAKDEKKRATLTSREASVRARFQAEIERYRYLTSENEDTDQAPTDQS